MFRDLENALCNLREYDRGQQHISPMTAQIWTLDIDKANDIVSSVREAFGTETEVGRFRNERHFESIIESLDGSFDGQQLYPDVETKATRLLYTLIKDHPFVDGNKRIATALFATYLRNNGFTGSHILDENTLTLLPILVAQSRADDPSVPTIVFNTIRK